MPQLIDLMNSLGQVARGSTLARLGVTRGALSRALADSTLFRVRRGWFATGLADSDQLRALALGGRVGCVSALHRWGAWAGKGNRLHVQLAPNASRLSRERASALLGSLAPVPAPGARARSEGDPLQIRAPGMPVLHWSERGSAGRELDWLEPPQNALAQALRCQDAEHALACIDSVIHHHLLTPASVRSVVLALPRHLHPLLDEITPAAESGWETIFIRRVRAGGYRVRPQVVIPGLGRIDGIIEECVGFEVNGIAFHSGPAQVLRDTSRILAAQRWDLPMISVNPDHIDGDWPGTWDAIVRVVESARARS
ncbi:hypothetical protein OSC27_01210 [Microbacterium sp. STN6]|uniref:hypothetical protein n=1 Tax=Microbacterium sp. STN6 TaxID=2995588 RepID=UPI002260D8A4|nr:hypothetical protein [Microbacterium sp. STN6]MCX7520889.1 hypothetical protein [Microbacterium sp. STN6]